VYSLDKIYGKTAFDQFSRLALSAIWKAPGTDLRPFRETPKQADAQQWTVNSFSDLISVVSFLTTMNKRLILFFRGQRTGTGACPKIFRDTLRIDGADRRISPGDRIRLWAGLAAVERGLLDVCQGFPIPRPETLRLVREARWAIIQHYELWPTPLIDITSSLRIAAAFALMKYPWEEDNPDHGFLYVVGLPQMTNSVSCDVDQHVVVARLASICPGVALRAHYQEGFLIGRFPLYDMDESNDLNSKPSRSDLANRLIAKIQLNRQCFWNSDFPEPTPGSIYPSNDPFGDSLAQFFGQGGPMDTVDLYRKLNLAEDSRASQASMSPRAG